MTPFQIRLFLPQELAAAAAATIVVVLVVVGRTFGMELGNGFFGVTAGIVVPYTVLGVLMLASAPRHPVSRLMLAAGLTAAASMVAYGWTRFAPLSWWLPTAGLIFLAVVRFPDGRLPSARWRPAITALIAGTAIAMITLVTVTVIRPLPLLTAPSRAETGAGWLVPAFRYTTLFILMGYSVVAAGSLWSRWRRTDADTRGQLTYMLPGFGALLVGFVLDWGGLYGPGALVQAAVPAAMTITILRYRLYDVDLLINRAIVWVLMTALVVVGFVAIVRILSEVLLSIEQTQAALVATGFVAVTFEPLRQRVQHGVNRLLYGDRDDPYLVIVRLGEVLGRTVDPTAVMPLVTGTIASSLQVPYVAIELQERDGPVLIAEHGRPVHMPESFDMVSHGEQIGRLLVAQRSTGARFSRHERRLLQDVALQAAVAAEATRLNRDLQASRERLVMTREEERRRLRRDLHDGLGPSFAGMSMQVHAALRLPPGDTKMATILNGLATDLTSCTREVRQLVDGLRPPALDLGLKAALRAECRRFDTTGATGIAGLSVLGLSVHCEVNGSLDGLPAAVEVAVFRVVAEALTNVAAHSRATACRVAIHRDTALHVEIVDNGVGMAGMTSPTRTATSPARTGVGLSSMRERAAELGGDCIVGPAPGQGTMVRLTLPLGPAQRHSDGHSGDRHSGDRHSGIDSETASPQRDPVTT